jgi:uncharacterized membrane protein
VKFISIIYPGRLSFRIIVFFLAGLWCTGILSVFLIKTGSIPPVLYPFLKYTYSIVCHQQGAKCFSFYGSNLLVCARCTGIYAGALFAIFIFIFIKKIPVINFKMALYSVSPVLADVILYNAGLYNYSKTIAFITGLLPGSVLILYILNSFENFFEDLKSVNE